MSVMSDFEALLALREGKRLIVYRDSRGRPTVGIGHLVRPQDQLVLGQTITQARCDALFNQDAAAAMRAAQAQAAQAGITDERFLPYLASVCYQLGDDWTAEFPNTWRMIVNGDYDAAADALDGSLWRRETPVRVADFQAALRRLPPKP